MTLKRSGSRLLTAAALSLFMLGVLGTLALATLVLTGCKHNTGGYIVQEGELTINGTPSGVYTANIYPYTPGLLVNAGQWEAATSGTLLAANGLAPEADDSAVIMLKTPQGESFTDSGTFLIVITPEEPATGRYYIADFTSGCATVGWAAMNAVPVTEIGKGILALAGTAAGCTYRVSVYSRALEGSLSSADFAAQTSGEPLASGETAADSASRIILKKPNGKAFNSGGRFLVTVLEIDGAGAARRTFYKTAVRFDANGGAALNLQNGVWPEPERSVLALVGTAAGCTYKASVYSYDTGDSLSYADFIARTSSAAIAEGATAADSANRAILKKPDGTDFDSSGNFLVTVLERGGYGEARRTFYKTAVPFDFGGTGLDLNGILEAPGPLVLDSFSAVIARMKEDAGRSKEYYAVSAGTEVCADSLTLSAANSPVLAVIDGGGRVVTGDEYKTLTVGAGVTLTLKNVTFEKIPFKVIDGGRLEIGTGAVIKDNKRHGSGSDTAAGLFDGTGVYVENGTLVMNGGLITGNNYSGVRVFGGSFTMSGGKISGNNADASGLGGGGVSVSGVSFFNMTGGTISGNTADGGGGGVDILPGGSVFNMSGGEISGNTAAAGNGGGVSMGQNTTLNMSGGVIRGNKAGLDGGGVYAGINSRFNMTGGTIGGDAPNDGNAADTAYGGGVSNHAGASMRGNMRVVSIDGAVNGGTGWTGLIEGYTDGNGYIDGKGPALIKNNRPYNVQFSSDGEPYIP